jgi:trigger factor
MGIPQSMQVTETLSEGLKRGFKVVIPASLMEERRLGKLEELRKTAVIPGFRPGRAPLAVLRQRFGKAVAAEVLEESLEEAARQLFAERGLRPALQPKVEIENPERAAAGEGDLAFALECEVLPEITVPDFETLTLPRLTAEVTEEAVEKVLAEIAGRHRELHPLPEPRPSAPGDVVTIDLEGTIEGKPFPGGSGQDMEVTVAGEGFIPGFSEQLAGFSEGETRAITVRFPEDYGAAELAGKEAVFTVTVKKIQEARLPAVDDAFAARIGFESLEELRETVKRQIARQYEEMSRLYLRRVLLDRLAERVSFPVPEGLVEAEFAQIWQRIAADRAAGRLDAEDAAKDEETLKAEYRAIAERRVRLGLLLAEVARLHNITVSEDELLRAMRREAARYPGQEARIFELYRTNPRFADSLRGPLLEDKVIAFILERVKTEERVVSSETLAAAAEGGEVEEASAAGAGEAAGAAAETAEPGG